MSTFKLSSVVEDIAIELDDALPVLLNGNKDFDTANTSDSGVTINVRKDDFGADLIDGADVTSADGSVIQNIVPVTLVAQSAKLSYTQLEEAYSKGNGEQIIKNRVLSIGSQMQKKAIDTLALGAGITVVQGTADSASYKDLRKAIAQIKDSRAVGEILAGVNPIAGSEVRDSGVSFFQADLSKTFSDGSIGKLDGVKTFESPDFGTLTTGTRVLTGALTVTTTINTDGATTLATTAATSLIGTVKKGEIIYATGITGVDVFGKPTSTKFAFIVQADVTCSGTANSFTVQPLVFTARDPNRNVGATSIPSGTVLTLGMAASTVYNRGIIWCKPAFIFANRPMNKVKGWDNMVVSTLKGLQFLATEGGNYDTGVNSVAWRVLTGFAVAYPQCVAVYYSARS